MMSDGAKAEALSPGRRVLAMASGTRSWFVALAPDRRRWLLAGTAMLVALAAGMMWYAGRPDWRVLFSGLEGRDNQQVSQELAAAGIPFQSTSDGTSIQVPAEMLDKARMEVAAKGMPQTGRLGFELFDKPNWVGSEFDERVNYQRALEGELEHTIATLGAVRSARVHLVMPQQTLFAAEEKGAKASVVLKLKRPSMPPEQIEQIRNLVAGAVENLSPEQVTLVDADGRVNLSPHGAPGTNSGDVEAALEAKLVAMLEPVAGAGNVRATVNVAYDGGTEERTDETYDPTQSAPLQLQKTEQTSGLQAKASGVPGTASNTPAAAPVGAVQGSAEAAAPNTPPLLQSKAALPVYPDHGSPMQSSKQENGTYAVSRHTVHSESGPGRLRRITAAVIVNDRELIEGSGKSMHSTWRTRTPEEMRRLESLAQAAVGFDEHRGDSVVLENVGFTSNTPGAKAAGLAAAMEGTRSFLATQPGLSRSAVLALLGVLLVMFVLRPVAGQLTSVMKEPALLAAGQTTVNTLSASSENIPLLEGDSGATPELEASTGSPEWTGDEMRPPVGRERFRPPASTRNGVHEQVAEHIRRDPAQSTRLLETWIAQGGE